jgi:hypothetical protein
MNLMEAEEAHWITIELILLILEIKIYRNSEVVWFNRMIYRGRIVLMEATCKDIKVSQVIKDQIINMMIWCANKVSRVNPKIFHKLTNCKLLTRNLKKAINLVKSKEWKINPILKKLKFRTSKRKNQTTFWWLLQKFKKVKFKLKLILGHRLKEVVRLKYKNMKIRIAKRK